MMLKTERTLINWRPTVRMFSDRTGQFKMGDDLKQKAEPVK